MIGKNKQVKAWASAIYKKGRKSFPGNYRPVQSDFDNMQNHGKIGAGAQHGIYARKQTPLKQQIAKSILICGDRR